MRTRRAEISDVPAIYSLIAHYAAQGLLLPRAPEEIRASIGHFIVQADGRRVISCLSLESYGADLAEIRSVAVAVENRGQGCGAHLIASALNEARRRGIARVFAVTHAPQFFERQGFTAAARQSVAEKIERDCRTCSEQRTCKLVAVIATVIPERVTMPILSDSAAPVPAC
ncbi:MAG TPA: GNAT family N-acetyltransferase [Candidatus Acidoferrales bacterium]|jgi:amino-acid N-acetyltransferase|nr:GNAT family N-acetyltransferase [Candidatus Acidoferrales bacterium]